MIYYITAEFLDYHDQYDIFINRLTGRFSRGAF